MPEGRRRYLVAYDIADPKRLRKVHKEILSYGWAMQYSVFIADLDKIELLAMKSALGEVIHHNEDSVAIIDLGAPQERGSSCFDFLGRRIELPTSGAVII